MSTDLTLPAARSQRDALADRTEVLNKVGALRMLPGNTWVNTEMVASFYDVDMETVKKVVTRNREELDEDGYRVVRRSELRDVLSLNPADLGLSAVGGPVALFPLRAVMRVGMLLTSSSVARALRTALLDSEESRVVVRDPANLSTLDIIEIARAAELGRLAAVKRAEAAEDFKRNIEAGSGLTIRAFHKKYFSAVKESELFDHLYARGYLINQLNKGTLRETGPKAGTYRDGAQHRHPTAKGKAWFYLHTALGSNAYRAENTRVLPGQSELDLRDRLAREGLPANINNAGLHALESDAQLSLVGAP